MNLEARIAAIEAMSGKDLKAEWERLMKSPAPPAFGKGLLARALTYHLQEKAYGGLSGADRKRIRSLAARPGGSSVDAAQQQLRPGTWLSRTWQGEVHQVVVLEQGVDYRGERYSSLSAVAREITGAHWSGPRFSVCQSPRLGKLGSPPMRGDTKVLRCAVYTRKSTDEGLEKDFNSLDAQREACEAYILSQQHEGWSPIAEHYDDGGFSGGDMERPALRRLLAAVKAGRVDVIVVYKIDRLTRSLSDFARIVDILDVADCSFVSVTQSFNTTSSMGRLTLNVLLSFAQFEREVAAERIRDKIAASKKRGMWMGGPLPLGYNAIDRKLVVAPEEAETVRDIMRRYLASDGVPRWSRNSSATAS